MAQFVVKNKILSVLMAIITCMIIIAAQSSSFNEVHKRAKNPKYTEEIGMQVQDFEEYFKENEGYLNPIEGIYKISWGLKRYNQGKLINKTMGSEDKYAIIREGDLYKCYLIGDQIEPMNFGQFEETSTKRLYNYTNTLLSRAVVDSDIRAIISGEGNIDIHYEFSIRETKSLWKERYVQGDRQYFELEGIKQALKPTE